MGCSDGFMLGSLVGDLVGDLLTVGEPVTPVGALVGAAVISSWHLSQLKGQASLTVLSL